MSRSSCFPGTTRTRSLLGSKVKTTVIILLGGLATCFAVAFFSFPDTVRFFPPLIAAVWCLKAQAAIAFCVLAAAILYMLFSDRCALLYGLPTFDEMATNLLDVFWRLGRLRARRQAEIIDDSQETPSTAGGFESQVRRRDIEQGFGSAGSMGSAAHSHDVDRTAWNPWHLGGQVVTRSGGTGTSGLVPRHSTGASSVSTGSSSTATAAIAAPSGSWFHQRSGVSSGGSAPGVGSSICTGAGRPPSIAHSTWLSQQGGEVYIDMPDENEEDSSEGVRQRRAGRQGAPPLVPSTSAETGYHGPDAV